MHKNTFAIDYALEKYGWAKLTFTDATNSESFSASYLTDVLGDLVRSALYLAAYGEGVKIHFDTEGFEYFLHIEQMDSNNLNMTLTDQDGTNVIHGNAELLQYLTSIQSIAKNVLKAYGAKGYKRNSIIHDFPNHELKLLDKKVASIRRYPK